MMILGSRTGPLSPPLRADFLFDSEAVLRPIGVMNSQSETLQDRETTVFSL